jgi:hypothetical protein
MILPGIAPPVHFFNWNPFACPCCCGAAALALAFAFIVRLTIERSAGEAFPYLLLQSSSEEFSKA